MFGEWCVWCICVSRQCLTMFCNCVCVVCGVVCGVWWCVEWCGEVVCVCVCVVAYERYKSRLLERYGIVERVGPVRGVRP